MGSVKSSKVEETVACAVTLQRVKRFKAEGGSGVSEIKQGTIKLRQALMALEAILKLALVQCAELRRSLSIIAGQTSPSTLHTAWGGWSWERLVQQRYEMMETRKASSRV